MASRSQNRECVTEALGMNGTNWNSLSSTVYFLAGLSAAALSPDVMVYKLNIY